MGDRVLVTGASGTTGSRLVAALTGRGEEVRAAGRRGPVVLDLAEPSTFGRALDGVAAVYVVPPPGEADPSGLLVPFLRAAGDAGVRRAVLLSALAYEPGAPGVGQVQSALPDLVPEAVTLRPSWFMQNFLGDHQLARSIRAYGVVRTATGEGRVAFVDADDIAAVAALVLTTPAAPDAELLLTGPQALTYDDVAAAITRTSGRPVRHEHVEPEVVRDEVYADMPPAAAAAMAGLDTGIAAGTWDLVSGDVERVTGRPARTFDAFAADHAPAWSVAA